MSVRTLSRCHYLLSNDIILKKEWCEYVPIHSYEQQGRFRYVCENTETLDLPKLELIKKYQKDNNWCFDLKTDTGNYLELIFSNGYSKGVNATSPITTVCVPLRHVDGAGTVKIKAYNSVNLESPEVIASLGSVSVEIASIFYPLTQKVWARIISSEDTEVKIYINDILKETYNSGSSTTHIYRSTSTDPENGTMKAIATNASGVAEVSSLYYTTWKKISFKPVTTPKITYTKPDSKIKFNVLGKIERSYFCGIDIGYDKIGVK